MTCNCVSQINVKLRESNHQLAIAWQIEPAMNDRIQILTSFVDKRAAKRGSKPTPVLATFCPFCGEKCVPDDK